MALDTNKLSIWQRLKLPSPDLFKKIKKIGVILTTASVITIAANSQFNLGLPTWIDSLGKYLAFSGFAATTVSGLTVDPNKIKEQEVCETEVVEKQK